MRCDLTQRIAERGDDRLLTDNGSEVLRARLAGESFVGHGVEVTGADEGFRRTAALGRCSLSLLPSGPDEVRCSANAQGPNPSSAPEHQDATRVGDALQMARATQPRRRHIQSALTGWTTQPIDTRRGAGVVERGGLENR